MARPAARRDTPTSEVYAMTNPQIVEQLHADALNLAALAGLVAHEVNFTRHVDERDRGLPDLGGVVTLLAERLAVHRDQLEQLLEVPAPASEGTTP
jgi:hypothetical protein